MNMIVCCKQVLDPEAPPASFKVDTASNQVVPPPNVPPVINPFDENAVEAALRIKDQQGGKITVICLGNNLVRDVVKKPLSMGSDELILLEDEAFEGGDSWSTAHSLAAAIKKIGEYDIIFCGRQASDWDAGQVGSGIAELLDIPSVTLAKKIEAMGVESIIYTNVLKDGTLERPQFEFIEEMLDAVDMKVIVAGGISSLQDIKVLKALNRDNLYGVIVGKALYEGKLDLKEAIVISEA